MKLKKHWTLLSLLTILSLSSLAQYPAVKKIGKDSVVIITLEQGNQINKKFITLEDSIKTLNSRNDSLKLNFQQEYRDKLRFSNEADSFRTMYLKNKQIYLEREEFIKKDRRSYMGFSAVLMFMVVFFANL